MNFDIEELKIVFYTNLSKKNKNIVFTKNLLYNPEKNFNINDNWNDYPYFTFDVIYPMDKLIYFSFKDRMEFFFNKQRFNEILLIYSQNEESLKNIKKDESYFKKRDLIIEKNVMIMLELLFPTKFPAVKNLKQSFHIVFGKTSIMNHLYNPFNNDFMNFSYLKIDEKIYTFKSLVWLNDILNHPVYRELIENYRKYKIWYDEETNKNFEIINKSMNELYIVSKNILYIVTELINDVSLVATIGNIENEELMDIISNFYELYYVIFHIVKNDGKISIVLNDVKLNNGLQVLITNIEEKINSLIKDELENKLFLIEEAINSINKIKNKKMNFENLKILSMNTSIEKNKNVKNKHIEIIKNYKLFLKNSANKQLMYLKLVFDLNNKTFNEITSEFQENNLNIPIEYKNFAYYTINQYKRPIRESSNIFLQNLINMSDNLNVKEFYSFMDKIIQYFVLNKQEIKLLKNEKKLLKTDINYINTNVRNGLKREIYVMVDFIEGELNDDVMDKMDCLYIDQRLGEFENLFRKFYYQSNENYWEVDKNRFLFSVDNMLKDLNDDNKVSQDIKNLDNTNINKNSENIKVTSDSDKLYNKNKINTLFIEKIVQNEQVKSALKELNDVNLQYEVNENDLINYIYNNNKILYNYIEKWSENEYDLSEDLLKNLIKLTNDYKTTVQILLNEEKSYNQENYEIKYKIKLNQLYANITDAVIENENKKNRILKAVGGLKKTKKNHSKINRTKKNVR